MPRARHNRPISKDKPVLVIDQTEYFEGKPHRLQVYLDWVAIIRTLGKRAVENKHGRATLMYGTIVVKVK